MNHLRLSLAIKQKRKITCYGELRMRLQKAQLRFPKVEAIRPKRWPAEWFSGHQQHGASTNSKDRVRFSELEINPARVSPFYGGAGIPYG
ncbi:hypothetical protein NC652_020460 [Populus alba x Populus x berolinensis]|nr:hypothetical protein NC652_020460 [Populus alba x Populus x berolinensis]